MTRGNERTGLEIAVIGMTGRLPGAANVLEYWQNMHDGRVSISYFSKEELAASGVREGLFSDPAYVPARGILEGVDRFDAAFFGYSPKEAAMLDPQQRLFLETAWQSLEVAGHDPARFGKRIGVFASVGFNSYLMLHLEVDPGFMHAEHGPQAMLSNDKDFLATRVSYKLALSGPSMTVQSACSSSLLAIHQACQSLLAGESDMAIAGGVTLRVPEKTGHYFQEGMINSPDGVCRPFDKDAAGTVAGNGVGVVVLKRLDDALRDRDHIHAVVRGGAVNNDADEKVGYAAPSVTGQARAISLALGMADVSPETIGYVEAHGSGTRMGDPIELQALCQAFARQTSASGYCAVGSAKANIGHCDAAAGVAGFMRAALAVENGIVPPNANFKTPNPECAFEESPFYVPKTATPWPDLGSPRRAGVSSFGMGGTNVHLVLEQAPERAPGSESREWQLLCISARTARAHDRMKENLRLSLSTVAPEGFPDMAYSLHVGRKRFGVCTAVVARSAEQALEKLSSGHNPHVHTATWDGVDRGVVFMFSGQGAQFLGMARELYERETSFRADIDECRRLLKPYMDRDLNELLFGEGDEATEQLNQTQYTQPALFAIEYSLARLLMRFGIKPEVLIGHSIGEYVAAALASVFSLADGLRVVATRGRLIQALPGGAMVLVNAPEKGVEPCCSERVSLAAVNAPELCVLSGDFEAIAAASKALGDAGLRTTTLRTSHAFHSAMMEPALSTFKDVLKSVQLSAPRIPIVSNLTGELLSEQQAKDPTYWVDHLRGTVQFSKGVARIKNGAPKLFLEVGPGGGLYQFARATLGRETPHRVEKVLPKPKPDEAADAQFEFISALGRVWAAGLSPDWSAYYHPQERNRVPLPPYPFYGESYWVDTASSGDASRQSNTHEGLAVWSHTWRRWIGSQDGGRQEEQSGPVLWIQQAAAKGNLRQLRDQLEDVTVVVRGKTVELERSSCRAPFDDLDAWDKVLSTWLEARSPGESLEVVYVVPMSASRSTSSVSDMQMFLHTLLSKVAEQALVVHLTVSTTEMFELAVWEGFRPYQRIELIEQLLGAASASQPGLSWSLIDRGQDIESLLWPLGGGRTRPEPHIQAMLTSDFYRLGHREVLAYRDGRRFIRRLERFDEAQAPQSAPTRVFVAGDVGDCAQKLIEGWHSRYGSEFVLVDIDEPGAMDMAPVERKLTEAGVPIVRIQGLAGRLSDGSHNSHQASFWFFLGWRKDPEEAGFASADRNTLLALDNAARGIASQLRAGGHREVLWFADTAACFGYPAASLGSLIQSALALATDDAGEHRRVFWDEDSLMDSHGVSPEELASHVAAISGRFGKRDFAWLGAVPAPVAALTKPLLPAATEDSPEDKTLYARPDLPTPYAAPVTERQKIICHIWRALFEVEQVGIHDNFFEFGGDSVMALKLVAALETQFKVALPLAEVFNSPTVATQANAVREFLEKPMADRKLSPLVSLQPRGDKPPFYCVHPAGGIVHCYIEMARALGTDQPFCALQHPGIDGQSGPYTSYDKMAELYVQAIKEHQPTGPYWVGGWSFGGTVAYDMACKLQEMGEEVAMLALFDSPGPSALYNVSNRPEFEFAGMMTFLSQALSSMFGAEINVPVEELRRVPREQQLDYLLDRAVKVSGSADLAESREALERIIDIFELTDRGEQHFKPRRYSGPVYMYRVQDMADYEFTAYKNHPQISAASFGWDALCDDLAIRFVPGTHMSMIFPPNVAVLCDKFRSDMQERALTMRATPPAQPLAPLPGE